MESNERRKKLEELLLNSTQAVKGSELAKRLSVSRQIIVQDIAILRARGVNVIATPVGYLIQHHDEAQLTKVIFSHHSSSLEEIKEELEIIVTHGGKVQNVIVEHPIYGEITANLNINYLNQIDEFIEKTKKYGNNPLSMLTDGAHYHTIIVTDEEMYSKIINKLVQKQYITL